jgi:hypothetical protein
VTFGSSILYYSWPKLEVMKVEEVDRIKLSIGKQNWQDLSENWMREM